MPARRRLTLACASFFVGYHGRCPNMPGPSWSWSSSSSSSSLAGNAALFANSRGILVVSAFAGPDFYSESLSSSSPAAAFAAGFFFFFLFLLPFDPVLLAIGCSRIFKISSSSIFLSLLIASRSIAGGADSLVRPFLVSAAVS